MPKLYFAKCGDAIKIGIAENVKSRLSSLQVGSAQPIELVASVKGDVYLERKFQQRLDEHRISGEWFKDCADVRAAIQEAVDTHDIAPLKYPKEKRDNLFGRVCKVIWPSKTAEGLAAEVGCSVRAAAYQISGEHPPSDRSMLVVINRVFARPGG